MREKRERGNNEKWRKDLICFFKEDRYINGSYCVYEGGRYYDSLGSMK